MPKTPNISDAEWVVMCVLWSRWPLSANDVVQDLGVRKSWSPATIKTMLNRLVKKGALAYESQGKRYLYRPRAAQDQCVQSESRSFLERVFGGAVAPMLNHFVQTTKLSRGQIAELRRILDRKEE